MGLVERLKRKRAAPAGSGGKRARRLLGSVGLEALFGLFVLLTWGAVLFEEKLLEQPIRVAAPDKTDFLTYQFADGGGSRVAALSGHPLAWTCELAGHGPDAYCGFGVRLDTARQGRGLDLAEVRNVEIRFDYAGDASSLRMDLKDRDARLAKAVPGAGERVNSVEFSIRPGRQTIRLPLAAFETADWWIAAHHIPEAMRGTAFGNVVALQMQTSRGAHPGSHRLRIEAITFNTQLMSPQTYYSLIIGLWLAAIGLFLVWRRRQARATERDVAARWRMTLDSIPQMVWSVSSDGSEYHNARWAAFTGMAMDGSPGATRLDLTHPDDRDMAEARWRESRKSGEPFEAEFRIRHHDGEYRYVLARAHPERGEDGSVARWYGTCTDIHDRFLAQQALWRSQHFTRQLIDATPDVILVIDEDGNIVFANEAAVAGLGAAGKGELTGTSWRHIVSPEIRRSARAALARGREQKSRHFVVEKLAGDGPKSWWDVVITPLASGQRRERFLVIARDISHQKKAEEQARWSARHDPLTQLPNRVVLQQELDRLVALRRPFAVMILDIDEFKEINDSLGHDAGDTLLCTFADRLKRAVGAGPLVARLGGDEFAVLLPGASRDRVRDVAARIFAGLSEPSAYLGTIIDCHTSIGASLFPSDGESRGELLKLADVALYVAKSSGRKNLKLFEPHMLRDVEARHKMMSTARRALQEDRIVPYYQPKIELATGRIAGFEALLRWREPGREVQTPDTIKAAFEDLGLAAEISNRMIARVLHDIRLWLDQGHDFGHVAFNASAAELRAPDFAERLIERLDRAAIPVDKVQLEVTETVFLGRGAEFVETALRSLSASGIRIALDDFGTGYASLSHLKSFPVDLLKIDRTFIRDLQTELEDGAIVDAVIGLGRSLHIDVIAEGVETASQHETLLALGCRYGQGFLYSRPVAAEDVARLCAGGTHPASRPASAAAA